MLGGLLKSGWQSDSAEKRRLAILKMNNKDDANQLIFEKLALNDPAEDVRQACITQLSAVAPLFKVYQNQNDATTKDAAKVAFCNLIGSNSELSESDFNSLLSAHSDASTLVAQYSPHSALRARLLDGLNQTEQAEAIADVHYAETRLHIAQQLDQIDALEIARRNLKGKDKKSEKVVRAKLEEYRSQQKLENENNASALALCEQMEFIAHHPEWRPEFKGKYEHAIQRWKALALTPTDSTISRFEIAAQSALEKVDTQTKQEDSEQAQVSVANNLERYCATLAPLNLTELAEEQLSINAILNEALATWLDNSHQTSPSEMLTKKFLAAQQALTSLSDLINSSTQEEIELQALASDLKSLSWPTHYSDLAAKAEAQSVLNRLRTQNSEQKKQYKDNLDGLHKRINRLLGTSNKGDIKKAKHELSATTKAANHYSGKERKTLDERLEMAADIVSKMNDWQNFAIEPKLVTLCESMEQLVGSESSTDKKRHPDKLAQEISKLQSNWKKLGHTDITDNHWTRFKAAADLAYAPCAVFFEQRKTTQKENLLKREPLVAKMQSLLDDTDWDGTPDYKKVETGLRDINNDWRKIKDVDRRAGQKQWHKLSAIRELIYQKLDLVYDANIDQKNQIIAQVNALTNGVANDDSLEKLKLFQGRWKHIGITRRKQDQEAWTLFRAAGDTLFEKVKGVRNEKRAVEDQQIGAYKDIIKQIHSLAKSATNLADADAEFDELNSRYESLPPLPKALPERLIERLESDFKRAGDAYSQAHVRIIQASKDDVINKLREKAHLCGQLEAAIADSNTVKVAEVEQQLKDIIILDRSLDTRFKSRLNAASDVDKSAANQARTLLCIDLEILLDAASPEHDKAQRMQIQLKRMKTAGIGQTPNERKSALAELKLDWLCLPGAEPNLQTSLEKRFADLIDKY